MTVYSVLKLSRHAGIGVADERVTQYGNRTYDVARKIHRLKPTSFVGFAGSLPHGIEVVDTTLERIADMKDSSTEDELLVLEDSYRRVRERKFQTGVLSRYGLTIEEFKAGKCDDTIKQGLMNIVNDPRGFELEMVFGGYDQKKDNFVIAAVAYPGTTYKGDKYFAIGSGADRADLVIGDELTRLSREMRTDIPLVTGARVLMKATRSAWRNVGVGGSGQVVYVDGTEYRELKPQDVTILHNLLYAEEVGMLPKEFVDNTFEGIFNEKTNSEEVLKDLHKRVDAQRMLRLFFADSLHL